MVMPNRIVPHARSSPGPRVGNYPKSVKPAMNKSQVRAAESNKQKQKRKASRARSPALPATQKTMALSIPHPEGKINENLQRKSSWYQSICDPIHGGDCKIPDEVGDETGTIQCVQRGTFTVTGVANQSGGVRSNTLFSCQNGLSDEGYSVNSTTSSTVALGWSNIPVAWDTSDVLISYAQGHRVVSAGLYVQPECSFSDCSGEVCFFVTPANRRGYAGYNSYVDDYGSTVVALNTLDPVMVRWFPYSYQDQTFTAFYNPNAPAVGGSNPNSVPFWSIGCVTSGVPAGVTFRFSFAINYEFLPYYNAINILDVAPSPTDVNEVDLVERWVAEEPVAEVVTEQKMIDPPSAVVPAQTDDDSELGQFGMFADILTEMLPYALDGLEVLGALI